MSAYSTAAAVVPVTVYEAQRRKNRVWTEIGWVDANGGICPRESIRLRPGYAWAGGWRLVLRPARQEVGPDGWQYTKALTADAVYYSQEKMGRGRRRRQWMRVQVLCEPITEARPFGTGVYNFEESHYYENERRISTTTVTKDRKEAADDRKYNAHKQTPADSPSLSYSANALLPTDPVECSDATGQPYVQRLLPDSALIDSQRALCWRSTWYPDEWRYASAFENAPWSKTPGGMVRRRLWRQIVQYEELSRNDPPAAVAAPSQDQNTITARPAAAQVSQTAGKVQTNSVAAQESSSPSAVYTPSEEQHQMSTAPAAVVPAVSADVLSGEYEHYKWAVMDTEIDLPLEQLSSLVWGADSPLQAKLGEVRRYEVSTHPAWGADNTREVSFMMPKSKMVKKSMGYETQTKVVWDPSQKCVVLSETRTPEVPYGKTFVSLLCTEACSVGPGRTRLRVTGEVRVMKKTMATSMITSGVKKGYATAMDELAAALREVTPEPVAATAAAPASPEVIASVPSEDAPVSGSTEATDPVPTVTVTKEADVAEALQSAPASLDTAPAPGPASAAPAVSVDVLSGEYEHYKWAVMDTEIDLPLEQLSSLVWGADSPLQAKLGEVRRYEVSTHPAWGADNTREVSFMMPKSKMVKKSMGYETQTKVVWDPSQKCVVLSETRTPEVPYGKTFVSLLCTEACSVGPGRTRLRVTGEVRVMKKTMATSMITSGVKKGYATAMDELAAALREVTPEPVAATTAAAVVPVETAVKAGGSSSTGTTASSRPTVSMQAPTAAIVSSPASNSAYSANMAANIGTMLNVDVVRASSFMDVLDRLPAVLSDDTALRYVHQLTADLAARHASATSGDTPWTHLPASAAEGTALGCRTPLCHASVLMRELSDRIHADAVDAAAARGETAEPTTTPTQAACDAFLRANQTTIVALASDHNTCAAAPSLVTRLLLYYGEQAKAMLSMWSSSIHHAMDSDNADIIADHLSMLAGDPRSKEPDNADFVARHETKLRKMLHSLRLRDLIDAIEGGDHDTIRHAARVASRDLQAPVGAVLAQLQGHNEYHLRFVAAAVAMTTSWVSALAVAPTPRKSPQSGRRERSGSSRRGGGGGDGGNRLGVLEDGSSNNVGAARGLFLKSSGTPNLSVKPADTAAENSTMSAAADSPKTALPAHVAEALRAETSGGRGESPDNSPKSRRSSLPSFLKLKKKKKKSKDKKGLLGDTTDITGSVDSLVVVSASDDVGAAVQEEKGSKDSAA